MAVFHHEDSGSHVISIRMRVTRFLQTLGYGIHLRTVALAEELGGGDPSYEEHKTLALRLHFCT